MIVRHLIALVRARQIRFRLETYGLYYPAVPDAHPWWKISPAWLRPFVHASRPYFGWLRLMDATRRGTPMEWRIAPGRDDVERAIGRLYPELETGR